MKENLKNKILDILNENCQHTPAEIATMLGADESLVISAIDELEGDKIILGYKAMINWEKIVSDNVIALIELKVTPQRGEGFDKIADRIYKYPQVDTVYLMSGGFDLTVIINGKTMKEVAMFVAEKLAPMESVVSTATHFVLKKYKEQGVIFTDEEVDDRQVITL
ncbi:MAG: Lrp/AsnC family transcriptional regulator [Ruminococcaceae bacterium]|jgi:DNA-binding Lrp family transcriptional regulator|nr:Lrp/AsnC family transcriptional regulator [Oscillospiraceae bacterium]